MWTLQNMTCSWLGRRFPKQSTFSDRIFYYLKVINQNYIKLIQSYAKLWFCNGVCCYMTPTSPSLFFFFFLVNVTLEVNEGFYACTFCSSWHVTKQEQRKFFLSAESFLSHCIAWLGKLCNDGILRGSRAFTSLWGIHNEIKSGFFFSIKECYYFIRYIVWGHEPQQSRPKSGCGWPCLRCGEHKIFSNLNISLK